jgi:predicted RNase H-like nuclease
VTSELPDETAASDAAAVSTPDAPAPTEAESAPAEAESAPAEADPAEATPADAVPAPSEDGADAAPSEDDAAADGAPTVARRRRRRRRHVPRFLGLDLAWAPRKSSGGAVIELDEDGGCKLVSVSSLRAHEDILSWLARNRSRAGTILAVNAPIIVENSVGRRPADQLLQEHFGRHNVTEYHVNTTNASHPRTIGRALMRMQFDPDPTIDGDRVVETANQATQIMLFESERPIRLKSGPVGARKDAVARFREILWEKLCAATPYLIETPALRNLLEADLPSSNGSRVGELEERLEAVLCAYTAAYLGFRGPESCAMLGDLNDGYVLLPTTRNPPQG